MAIRADASVQTRTAVARVQLDLAPLGREAGWTNAAVVAGRQRYTRGVILARHRTARVHNLCAVGAREAASTETLEDADRQLVASAIRAARTGRAHARVVLAVEAAVEGRTGARVERADRAANGAVLAWIVPRAQVVLHLAVGAREGSRADARVRVVQGSHAGAVVEARVDGQARTERCFTTMKMDMVLKWTCTCFFSSREA